jgi:hypothetical protein
VAKESDIRREAALIVGALTMHACSVMPGDRAPTAAPSHAAGSAQSFEAGRDALTAETATPLSVARSAEPSAQAVSPSASEEPGSCATATATVVCLAIRSRRCRNFSSRTNGTGLNSDAAAFKECMERSSMREHPCTEAECAPVTVPMPIDGQ